MNISGVGAKVALALLLFGPLSLTQLADTVGISRRETLYRGITEASRLGLVLRVGRGMFAPVGYPPLSSISPLAELERNGVPRSVAEGDGVQRLESLTEEQREHDRTGHAVSVLDYRLRQRITESVTKPTESVTIQPNVILTESVTKLPLPTQTVYNRDGYITQTVTKPTESVTTESVYIHDGHITESVYNRSGYTESVGNGEVDPVTLLLGEAAAADGMVAEYTFPPQAAYIQKHRRQTDCLERLVKELFPTKTVTRRSIEEWLRVAGHRAYFVATVLDEIAASGKDIESLFAYVKAAITKRVNEGNIPLIPVELAQEEVTPALRANLDRVKSLNIWGSDDE